MSEQQTFVYISSVLSLIGLGYLFVQYRLLCMEFFRQDLFQLRDDLFDYARKQNIAFNDPAYAVLRLTINGWIRFAHQRTMWQGLLFFVLMSKADKEYVRERGFERRWAEAVAPLDDTVKAQLEEYREKLDWLSLRYFFMSAPECLAGVIAVLFVALPATLIYRKRGILTAITRKWFVKTDGVALFYAEQSAAF